MTIQSSPALSRIRQMAIEIMSVTSAMGSCPVESLRGKFSSEEIAVYGPIACADANSLASRGPFEIGAAS